MLYLYTSETNPKGVAAREFLQAKQVEFTEVNLDAEGGKAAEERLRRLLPDMLLPALTQVRDGQIEQLLGVGFTAEAWQVLLQQGIV